MEGNEIGVESRLFEGGVLVDREGNFSFIIGFWVWSFYKGWWN